MTHLPAADSPDGSPPAPLSALATARTVYRAVWPFVQDFRVRILALFALSVFSSLADAAGVGFALVFAVLVFRETPDADFDAGALTELMQRVLGAAHPTTVAIILFVVVTLRIAADGLHTVLTTTLDAEIGHRVRLRVLRGQLFMPQLQLEQYSYGNLTTLLNEHSWAVADAFDTAVNMAKAACTALVLGVLVLAFSWYTAVAGAAGMLLTGLLTDRLRQISERLSRTHVERAERMSARALRVLQAIRSIRIFGREQDYYERFSRDSEQERDLSVRGEHIANAIDPIGHFFSIATLAAVAAIAVWLEGSYQPAIAAMAILYRMYPFVTELLGDRVGLASLIPHLESIESFVKHSEQEAENGSRTFENMGDGITLSGVSFSYPSQDAPCLRDLDGRIPAHGWTVLQGPSGAGKSTLIGILLGALRPEHGEVRIGGVPLPELNTWSWRQHVAVAGQDIELIDGSVYDNIRLGAPQAKQEQVAEAARLAEAAEFIDKLPRGYRTRVGERGISLSGGQRQRIGIARALLRNPQLLILDEATNALDPDLEASIIANVARLMRGRAVLVVAHHLPVGMPICSHIHLGSDRDSTSTNQQ